MIVKELLDKTFYNNVEIKYFNNSHLKAVVMNIPLLVTKTAMAMQVPHLSPLQPLWSGHTGR